jgi:uncharacterized protein
MSDDHEAQNRSSANPQDPERRSAAARGVAWPYALIAVLLAAGIALGGVALGRRGSSTPGTITVTGSGSVKGTPDTVGFDVGANTTASSAAQALSLNNAKMTALESTLLRHGVLRRGMKTSGLNIYENTQNGVVTGFTVSNTLNVSVHGVKRAGRVLDAAVRVVGNGVQLYGVSFSIANNSSLLAGARAKAMQSARTTAGQLAAGGGAHLGAIVRVTQANAGGGPVYPFGFGATASQNLEAVPLQAGRQSVNVQVTVVYALNT